VHKRRKYSEIVCWIVPDVCWAALKGIPFKAAFFIAGIKAG
jgi:hypothetical protein